MFLTEEEVAELTGIKTARGGVPRARRQSRALGEMAIPHYVNAINRVIVVRAVLEGRSTAPAPVEVTWEPAPLPAHSSTKSRPPGRKRT